MKTFEERYTAWIDGQLTGPALTAFEQEIARRAAAGEAEADRTDTARLRYLLREHLEAPTLTNPEFFSHQLRERLNADRASTTGRTSATAGRSGLFSFLPWSVMRLAGMGAACLFVAGALYYGLEPGAPSAGGNGNVAVQKVPVVPQTAAPAVQVAEAAPAPTPRDPSDQGKLVKRDPVPPSPLFDDSKDIQVHEDSPASGTGLRYQKSNVDVLWTNGLEYLPDVPGAAGAPANAPATAPVPSASAVQ